MDRVVRLRYLRPLAVLLLCLTAGCERHDPPPIVQPELPAANTTIARLRSLFRQTAARIDSKTVIRGRIIADDRSDNFYRSIIVDDGTGSAEILTGLADAHTLYPVGHTLAVDLTGWAIGMRYGVLQIGLLPTVEQAWPQSVGVRALLDGHLSCGESRTDPQPATLRCEELDESLCGRLVRIENLAYAPDDESEDDGLWSGYRRFTDPDGTAIVVTTSSYADFAAHAIPRGTLTLTGILQYGRSGGTAESFLLKLRDENDCRIH